MGFHFPKPGNPGQFLIPNLSTLRGANGPFFWNEVASGFIAGLVARHTLEFERRTRGVLGKDVLTRLTDYVIAHIDEPIEVSTLEDSGAQPVPFYPVVHPIRWRQSAPLRRAFCDGNERSSLFVMSDPAWPMSRCAQALPTKAISRVGSGAFTAFP
jgi:hypothetical protein